MLINKNKSNFLPKKGSFRKIQENYLSKIGLNEDEDYTDHENKMFALNPGIDKGKVRPELIKIGKDIAMIAKKAKGDTDKAIKDIGAHLKKKGFKGDGQDAIWPMKGAQWFLDSYQGEYEPGLLVDMTVSKTMGVDISTGKVDKWEDQDFGIYRPDKSDPSGYSL